MASMYIEIARLRSGKKDIYNHLDIFRQILEETTYYQRTGEYDEDAAVFIQRIVAKLLLHSYNGLEQDIQNVIEFENYVEFKISDWLVILKGLYVTHQWELFCRYYRKLKKEQESEDQLGAARDNVQWTETLEWLESEMFQKMVSVGVPFDRLDILQDDLKRKDVQLQRLQNEKSILQRDLVIARDRITEYEDVVDNLMTKAEELEVELRQKNDQISSLHVRGDSRDLEQLAKESSDHKAKITQLEKSLDDERNKFQSELHGKNGQIKSLQDELEATKDKVSNSLKHFEVAYRVLVPEAEVREKVVLLRKLKESEDRNEELQAQVIDELRADRNTETEQVADLKAEVESLQARIREMEGHNKKDGKSKRERARSSARDK